MMIRDIENLTYDKAKKMAIEELQIKGHDCLIVDLDDGFGYSVLVFKNGKHIHYANDYELHHGYIVKEKGKEALRQWYIDTLNNKLFTDEELLDTIDSYDEYNKKEHFLRNYWIMRFDYVSIFGISTEDKKAIEKGKRTHPFFNPVSFCYVAEKDIVDTSIKYFRHLQEEYEKISENLDTFREMISYQLANHEACITCDYTEALYSLGLKFDELSIAKQKIVKEELSKQIEQYCC